MTRRLSLVLSSLSCFAAALFAQPVLAVDSSISVQAGDSLLVYRRDFDVLATDFTIQTDLGNKLNTITVLRNGTARQGIEFTTVRLWADRGVAGLQGWGYDQELAVGQPLSGVWVFNPLNFTFTSEQQRFFITIDSGVMPSERPAEFALQPGLDNGDGLWQDGETGIFLSSGVMAAIPNPPYTYRLQFKDDNTDAKAPQAYLDGLSLSATSPTPFHDPSAAIHFVAHARDRNGGSVSAVQLLVNNSTFNMASAVVAGETIWTYDYLPVQPYETLNVRVMATDSVREATSESFYAVIDRRQPSLAQSAFVAFPAVVMADGVHIASLSLTLLDIDGQALPYRDVSVSSSRSQDVFSKIEGQTDLNGFFTATIRSNAPGASTISLAVHDVVFATTTVTFTANGLPGPDPEPELPPIGTGSLIKGSLSAVYYYGSDGKRHVFVNQAVYASWYGNNFSEVRVITDVELAKITLGESVGFRPGSLIKVPSVPAVYVVDRNLTLRHVSSEALALELFGGAWNTKIHDLSESLLFAYNFGDPITQAGQLNQPAINDPTLIIDTELSS